MVRWCCLIRHVKAYNDRRDKDKCVWTRPAILALPMFQVCRIGAQFHAFTSGRSPDWSGSTGPPYPCRCDEVPPFRDRSCISQVRIAKDRNVST